MLEISDTFTPEQTDTSPRLSVCLDAVYELDALARALPGLMPIDERGQAHLVTRGIAARMLRLTKSLLDGLTEVPSVFRPPKGSFQAANLSFSC